MNNVTGSVIFREQQRFINKRLSFTLFLIACVFTTFVFISGFMRGSEIVGPVIMILVIYLFYRLELIVEVRHSSLLIRFSPLIKRNVPLSDIIGCDVRTYRPIIEYGGWGIRRSWRGKGKAYNVKGNRGVQLKLRDGESILIGSQRPEELEAAMRSVFTHLHSNMQ
jgi:hypothetical protein